MLIRHRALIEKVMFSNIVIGTNFLIKAFLEGAAPPMKSQGPAA